MTAKRFRPWVKGPARIIQHTAHIHRAWVARELVDGTWFGELFGDDVAGPRSTEIGAHHDLLRELKLPATRHGLPIVEIEFASGRARELAR